MEIIYFIVQQTMFFAIPLLIVALGGCFRKEAVSLISPWKES